MSFKNFINRITGKSVDDANAWRFRTSIMCNGCIAKITPVLDGAQGVVSWKVNLDSPDRVLTIVPDGITQEALMTLVREAGFTIERL